MAGTDELLSRLAALEDGYYGDKEAQRQKMFFDTYGDRFSNNRGLGLAILNELDARGIDTTAADEAVQQILDQLRTECNEIINSIKVVQEQAIQSAQKVEQVANVVAEAAAANPEADTNAVMPPPMPPMDPNTVPMPPEEPAAEPEAQAAPEPAPAAEPEAQAAPETPAEEPQPQAAVSDARMKQIRGVLSDVRAKRIKASANNAKPTAPKKENNCFKPSAGMLEAASRGF